MKKNFKRTLAKVMAVALTVALAGTAAPNADAAKKIKLSSKSITVTKGKTKKVTIKNVKAKKVKKLTVTSSKKKVATVKKSGKTAFKVTGKKVGSAKVTVKVTVKGQKKATKLTLSVKVKSQAAPKVTAAPTVAPTTAPTTAPTVAPTPTATSDNGGNKDNGGNNGDNGGNNGGDNGGNNGGDNGGNNGGDNGDDTPVVESEMTEIKNIQLGGVDAEKITYFESKDGVTDLILNSECQYGNVFTYFDLVLPEGASVADIKKITYDVEGVYGDLGNKFNALLVGSPDENDACQFPVNSFINYVWTPEPGHFEGVHEVYRSVTYGASFNGGTVSEEVVFDEDMATEIEDLEITGNTLRFSVFTNLEGKPTEYKIKNIKVYTTKGIIPTEGFDKPGEKIDKVSTAEVEASITGKVTVAKGETIGIEAAISNSLIVGEAQDVVWTSSNEDVATVEGNLTSATVTGVESGTTEISAAITTTKGKTKTVKATISVTAVAVQIPDLTIGENTVMLQGDGTDGSSSYWHAGGKKFADLTGYPDDFNISNYNSIVVTVTLYSDTEGTSPITDYSALGNGAKFTLADDSVSVWGDNLKRFYLNKDNLTPDSEGKVVMTFKADEIENFGTATGFSAQGMSTAADGSGIQKMVINSVVFKA